MTLGWRTESSVLVPSWGSMPRQMHRTGDGSAELLDDGTMEIEFNRHLGDEAVLKAVQAPY
ncbi:MAG: hypothetical protein AAGI03_09265 [Pseudomonadota bacterium]